MRLLDTRLPGIKRIELQVFNDERGYFLESYQAQRYAALLPDNTSFVQDNCSHSAYGVLRGLHYQDRHPQGKLVRVSQGQIFDVVVDLRRGSPTYGQWEGLTLSAWAYASNETHTQLWIPPGFAHGFLVLSDTATVEYKCTEFYRPDDEVCVQWNDPDLAILWPNTDPILSDKDRRGLSLNQLFTMGRLP